MQKITTFLWFDNDAEQAINHYLSIFKDSKMLSTSYVNDGKPGEKGKLMTAGFQLEGQEFLALNGGPMFKFTEAISLLVNAESQEEIDYYWERLCEGGSPSRCGWLKDKFGLSWQIVPPQLGKLMSDPDRAKANRVMQAMLKMDKIILADLEKAARGE